MSKKILILGAGPTGLTSAYELLRDNPEDYDITIFEKDPNYVGGIARTVKYGDYRFDIGGHRFFSKTEEVMDWWYEIMGDEFLERPRLSRWYYRGKFFTYPIKPFEILKVFGLVDTIRMFLGYLRVRIFPIKPEKNLADYYTNQFGTYLAKPFFIDYNEKLWGVPCDQLAMDFGKQRVKGLSFTTAVVNALKQTLNLDKHGEVKSLINKFNYPKHGPGQLWERVQSKIEDKGAEVQMGAEVVKLKHNNSRITSVVVRYRDGSEKEYSGDYILSTIPYKELVKRMDPQPPQEVLEAANELKFRDFITVALIIDEGNLFPDNWVYTHDEGMKPLRVQNFNNWSPYLMPNPDEETVLGIEYACSRGDELWEKPDEEMIEQAIDDVEKLDFANRDQIKDAQVERLTHVYPVYTVGYKDKVNVIRDWLDRFNRDTNWHLQPIGRGGIHRYNNMDHSMMTAFLAVKNIKGEGDYDIWKVNEDAEYHEEKKVGIKKGDAD